MELIELEQRVAALEKEVIELKKIVGSAAQNGNWIERITGSMEKYPEFGEVIRLGAEFRRSQRDAAEHGAEP